MRCGKVLPQRHAVQVDSVRDVSLDINVDRNQIFQGAFGGPAWQFASVDGPIAVLRSPCFSRIDVSISRVRYELGH